MRHKKRGRKLGRTSAHRKALGKNLLISLFQHGQIITTISKAKMYAPQADKIITLAKRAEKKIAEMEKKVREKNPEETPELKEQISREAESIKLAYFRRALAKLQDEKIVRKVFYDLLPIFRNRKGGYTSILHLNKRRVGDNAPQAVLRLVEKLPKQDEVEKARIQRKEEKEKRQKEKEEIKRKRKERQEKEKEKEKIRKEKEKEKLREELAKQRSGRKK